MSAKELVLGRGTVWLNLFDQNAMGSGGDGERYLGNTPGFTLTARESAVERKGSIKGVKSVIDRYVTSRDYTATMICDEISEDNLMLWLGGEVDRTVVDEVDFPKIEENFNSVLHGRTYQLGTTDEHPLGHRFISNVEIDRGIHLDINLNDNVVIDYERARVTINDNAPNIPNDSDIVIKYKTDGYVRRSNAPKKVLRGSMRYLADNVVGINSDYYFPFVSIEASGTLEMKTADWQRLQFSLTVMQRPGRELFYAGSFNK